MAKKAIKEVEAFENDFPQMKENGFQEAFEKLTVSGDYVKVIGEVIQTNEFGYYMNSHLKDFIISLYDENVDAVIDEFIKENPKVKKITKTQAQSVRSLAVFLVLDHLDMAIDDENHCAYDIAYLLLNNYFFTVEKVSCAIAASVNKFGKEIKIPFTPLMSFDKAHKKNLKQMGTKEWDNIIVPAEVKYQIAKVKAHIDYYIYDEFIKSEYNMMKLMGYNDEQIIDYLDSEDCVLAFCAYCDGYREGVKEAKEKEEE